MSEPKALQVADAIVTRLKLISHARNTQKWYTEPSLVEIGPTLAKAKQAGPVLFVEVTNWSDQPIGASLHEATLDVRIACYVQQSKEPQRDVHRIAADVIKAIAEKDTDRLDGLVQMIWVVSYTAESEFVEQAGRGRADVTVRAIVRWTHGAP